MNTASRYLLVVLAVTLAACQSSPGKHSGAADVDLSTALTQAEAAYAAGDWHSAQPHYEALALAFPQDARHWFRLGNIYARTDRPDPAIAAYREAAIRDPSSAKIWFNMGLVQLRQSANSFLKMELYVEESDPLAVQGSEAYARIMQILGEESSATAGTDASDRGSRQPSVGSLAAGSIHPSKPELTQERGADASSADPASTPGVSSGGDDARNAN